MMSMTLMTGMGSSILLLVALTLKIIPESRLGGIYGLIATVVMIAIFSLPLKQISIAEFVRGMTGDLSITSLVLLTAYIVRRLFSKQLFLADQSLRFYILISVVGILFYPMALGLGDFDPYSLGYQSTGFLLGLLVVAVFSWIKNQTLMFVCISLAEICYGLGWYESTNLWDYLIDPLLSLFSAVACLKYFFRQRAA